MPKRAKKEAVYHHYTTPFACCGGKTRTYDLWVMSPTSYHCSTPRCIIDSFPESHREGRKNVLYFQTFRQLIRLILS